MFRYKDKKIYSVILILLLIQIFGSGIVFSGTEKEQVVPKHEIYGAYRDYKGDYGFFNYYGSLIKKAQFELLWQWDDEVLLLKKDGKFGALNYYGRTVVPFEYEFLDRPSNGTIIYASDIDFKGPKYYGLIDTKGKQIVEAQFDEVEKLPNGGIVTTIHYKTGKKYGVVFKNKVNVKPVYDGVEDYNEQFVIVKNNIGGQDKYGYISENGSRSETIYTSAVLTKDGDYVITGTQGKAGVAYNLYNRYGVAFTKTPFSYISPKGFWDNKDQKKYFCAVMTLASSKGQKSLDLMTASGELKGYHLDKVDYTPVLGQYYPVTDLKGLIGLVDSFGNMMIQPEFTEIVSTNRKYLVGRNANGIGVFNIKGEAIIDYSNYDAIKLTEDNLIIAQEGNRFNIFNEQGYLQFQFTGEDIEGIGHKLFIAKKHSTFRASDGTPKYYYSLVDAKGHALTKENYYTSMTEIGEELIGVGRDTDNQWTYPTGSVEYLRAPFSDLYGVIDYKGNEVLPVKYNNLSRFDKGIAFGQKPGETFLEAFNTKGKKINEEHIKDFDPFNWGVVTYQPHMNIIKHGYLNKDGEFMQIVYEQIIDDTLVSQQLIMEEDLINVVETKTTTYAKEVIENLINEEIVRDYYELKNRYGGEIYILKDKKWYLDTFSQ